MWMLPSYMRRPFIMQPKPRVLAWLIYLLSLGGTCTPEITWTKKPSSTPVWDPLLISAWSSTRVSLLFSLSILSLYRWSHLRFFLFRRYPSESTADQQSGCERVSRQKSPGSCFQTELAQSHYTVSVIHATSRYWNWITREKPEMHLLNLTADSVDFSPESHMTLWRMLDLAADAQQMSNVRVNTCTTRFWPTCNGLCIQIMELCLRSAN